MAPPNKHQFPRCPNCLAQVVTGSKGCPSCGREFGAPLEAGENANPDPELLRQNRWTWVSLGRDPLGRMIGKVIAAGFITFILYAWLVYAMSTQPSDGFMVLVVSGWGLFSAHEIWAFTHGRPTSIPRVGRYEATPANTGQRLFSLLLDMAVMALCAWMFLKGV